MLIVCPNCATSYMIDPASVGPAGRAVRCARCKSTWFAGATDKPATGVSAFVDGVIAEAEAESSPPAPPAIESPALSDDFGGDRDDHLPRATEPDFGDPSQNRDLAPRADETDERHAGLTITDAPSLVPPLEYDERGEAIISGNDPEEADNYLVRTRRLKAKRLKAKRMSRWSAIILVLFAFNVALIGARSEVVRYLPQTASLFAAVGLPVNLRNLKFDKVRIVKEAQDGVNILIIDGVIANTANRPTDVPRLRFSARNATGQEVYTWTALPARSILAAGETLDFQSRLAAPPPDATDVMVRFFNAQDAASGGK